VTPTPQPSQPKAQKVHKKDIFSCFAKPPNTHADPEVLSEKKALGVFGLVAVVYFLVCGGSYGTDDNEVLVGFS